MNAKFIIGSLVGGLILFIYQFLSWGALDLHYSDMQFTPAGDQILESLNRANLEEGHYFIPRGPKGNQAAAEQIAKYHAGQPWARVEYFESFKAPGPMNFIRGLIIDIVAAGLLIFLIGRDQNLTMGKAISACLAVGIIGYLLVTYLNHIWFGGNTLPYLLDAILSMTAVGAWLGWWLCRGK